MIPLLKNFKRINNKPLDSTTICESMEEANELINKNLVYNGFILYIENEPYITRIDENNEFYFDQIITKSYLVKLGIIEKE